MTRAATVAPPAPAGWSVRALSALLLGAGVTHFVAPRFYDAIVPGWLPGGARLWTHLSGVAEFGLGVAVAVPRTRRLGALGAAGLFVAVFPANIKMALDAHGTVEQVGNYLRLPVQVPLVVWAYRVARPRQRDLSKV